MTESGRGAHRGCSLHDLLTDDHARLDALLGRSLAGEVDEASYGEFRRGLLRHIGIEERIVFPELRRVAGSTEIERRLHRDHAALAALLVAPPDRKGIEEIRMILAEHNPLEEGAGGLYEMVERLPGVDIPALAARAAAYPAVPTAPYSDSATLRRSIEELLRRRREP